MNLRNLCFSLMALSLVVFVSCMSSKKFLRNGNYDAAIEKSVRKLRKHPNREKETLVLEEAYNKAKQRDESKIIFLKKEGSPDSWNQIFDTYSQLKARQEMIKTLPQLTVKSTGRKIQLDFTNYDDELIDAKQKASEFYYVRGQGLLQKGGKQNARNAYYDFMNVKHFYPNYKDLNTLMNQAKADGMSYALFKMSNATGVPLPPDFETELTKISLADMQTEWLTYDTQQRNGLNYDYTILVNMKNISVSPEAVKETQTTENKQVPDGFQYVLDSKGNVKKDSTGNDIKIPKTKTISCNVMETYQSKKATIAGTLDYMNNGTNQMLKTDPIMAENFFEFRSAGAIGDLNALSDATKKKIGPPQPFPNNFAMLLQAGQTLKGMCKNIIAQNKNVLW